MELIEGGCLCSSIRYRISGLPVATSLCHCNSCRRASGAPSVAWCVVRTTDFAFSAGAPIAFRSSPAVVRTFCGKCGTPLTYQHDDSPDTIDVTTSTLDFPERFAPMREIWLEHKLPWETTNEALPQFPRSSAKRARSAT